jgi:hypothetical protein
MCVQSDGNNREGNEQQNLKAERSRLVAVRLESSATDQDGRCCRVYTSSYGPRPVVRLRIRSHGLFPSLPISQSGIRPLYERASGPANSANNLRRPTNACSCARANVTQSSPRQSPISMAPVPGGFDAIVRILPRIRLVPPVPAAGPRAVRTRPWNRLGQHTSPGVHRYNTACFPMGSNICDVRLHP